LRDWLLTLAAGACACAAACGKDSNAPRLAPRDAAVADAALPAHQAYPDLAAALLAIIPADARVVGIGELHARTDRAAVTSSLTAFTRALPAIGDRISDLVLETWITAPACGAAAVQATARVESTVKRPEATKSEISDLATAARAAGIQSHAMTLTCADYAAIAPPDHEIDAAQLLTVTTRELTRIATSAVRHRDREPTHRPWIAVYGGALHNDRFPDDAVAEWSYAAEIDRVTGDHFVEIDIIVPALAAADPTAPRQPWFPLTRAPRDPRAPVLVWTRGERSFVVVLP
jgi:hypothetical protein